MEPTDYGWGPPALSSERELHKQDPLPLDAGREQTPDGLLYP